MMMINYNNDDDELLCIRHRYKVMKILLHTNTFFYILLHLLIIKEACLNFYML